MGLSVSPLRSHRDAPRGPEAVAEDKTPGRGLLPPPPAPALPAIPTFPVGSGPPAVLLWFSTWVFVRLIFHDNFSRLIVQFHGPISGSNLTVMFVVPTAYEADATGRQTWPGVEILHGRKLLPALILAYCS